MAGKPGMKRATSEQIAEARRLRATGLDYDGLVAATGMTRASLHRYCRDVFVPKRSEEVTASIRAFERSRKDDMSEDRERNKVDQWETDQEPAPFKPDALPKTAEGYDLDGLFPDPALVAWASSVIGRWLDDRAKGKLFFGVPIEVVKAGIITSTMLRPWDPQWWRENRERWTDVRAFTTLGTHDLAERIGISPSSLGRYEKGQRSPSKGISEQMRIAYAAAMEDRLHNLDLWLGLESYIEHLAAESHDVEADEFEYNFDEALKWITGAGPNGEVYDQAMTLDHLPHLAHVRSLQPRPEYRDEGGMLFGWLGFATDDREEVTVTN